MIFEIAKIYTNYKPYVYKLRDPKTKKIAPGYFNAFELRVVSSKFDKKYLDAKILKRMKNKQQQYKLVSYKDLPS